MIKKDDDDRIIQRLLQANDVQSALNLDQTQWRTLKVVVREFREGCIKQPWGKLEHDKKKEFCNMFRSYKEEYQAILACAETPDDPWCSWFLITNAKPTSNPAGVEASTERTPGQGSTIASGLSVTKSTESPSSTVLDPSSNVENSAAMSISTKLPFDPTKE